MHRIGHFPNFEAPSLDLSFVASFVMNERQFSPWITPRPDIFEPVNDVFNHE